jgi:hypothetical protein
VTAPADDDRFPPKIALYQILSHNNLTIPFLFVLFMQILKRDYLFLSTFHENKKRKSVTKHSVLCISVK